MGKKKHNRWAIWLEGLMGAGIGGGAGAIIAALDTPEKYNLQNMAGFLALLKFAVVSGVVSAALYLRQKPTPKP